jgi:Na+-driven multidrug efflux pump
MTHLPTRRRERPRLNAVAVPLFGEFLVGMTVALVGLWLASATSDAAAGAFGLASQVLETVFVLFRLLAIGLGVVITQALGGGRHDSARRTAIAGLGASTWAGLLAAACVLLGHGAMLRWLNAPAEVHALAAPLLALLAPAVLLEAYNLSLAAILRAHLHARDSLRVMLAMHATHLVLALLLMRGIGAWPGLGLPGYALAMLASRALGLTLHLLLWRQRLHLVPRPADWWRLPLPLLSQVLRVGVPGAATEMVYRLAFMASLAATAQLGVAALATHSYTLQLLKYVAPVSLAIGWACEIMVGRLTGAGQLRAASALVRKGVRNGLLASGGLALLMALGAPWLLRLFTTEPEVLRAAQALLWLSLLLETGRVYNLVLAGALRAADDVLVPAAASMASMALVLGAGSLLLAPVLGLPGIWLAYILDEWVRGLLLLARWLRHGWVPHARRSQQQLRASALRVSSKVIQSALDE